MKLWIRVDAASPDDPRIAQLAGELRLPDAHAFGLCVAVWCRMSEHATTGSLAAVTPALLERWAGWRGKAGRFAAAFLDSFVGDDGKVRGWEERQGALLTRMERDRARHRRTDKLPGDSTEPPRKFHGTSAETPAILRGDSTSTERNGTEQKRKRSAARGAAAPIPHWLAPIAAVWESVFGPASFNYPKGGAALKPLHDAGIEAETIAVHLAQRLAGVDGREARFVDLHKFRETFAAYAPKAAEPAFEADGMTLTRAGRAALGLGAA